MGNRIKDHALLNFFTFKPNVVRVKEKLMVILWEKVKADSLQWNYNYIFSDSALLSSWDRVAFVQNTFKPLLPVGFPLSCHQNNKIIISPPELLSGY